MNRLDFKKSGVSSNMSLDGKLFVELDLIECFERAGHREVKQQRNKLIYLKNGY
ncbi:MAG: hypothetical protein U9N10_08600 [Bacillota bacterium]|nr:hypothetical protein [Bacillota bacterium]